MKDIVGQPEQKRAQAKQGGGKKRVAARRAKGKLARERFRCRFAMLRDFRPENLGNVPQRGGV